MLDAFFIKVKKCNIFRFRPIIPGPTIESVNLKGILIAFGTFAHDSQVTATFKDLALISKAAYGTFTASMLTSAKSWW